MAEGLGKRVEAASLFIDVEVIQERLAVAEYPKHTTADAAGGWSLRTKIMFREMQHYSVAATSVNRDGIGETSKSLSSENIRIGCPRNCVKIRLNVSLHEVVVRMPELSEVIYIGCAAGDEANG